MKKLPIGIQTFKDIIEQDYIYIDKTDIAYEVINGSKYAFLSRPRRFGKSLFLDTLQEIFEGNKKLFEGLAIYNKWDWSIKYPVIKISWDGQLKTITQLEDVAFRNIDKNQQRLGVSCKKSSNISVCLDELIQATYEKYNQRVVVLIDEYDKPILDNIENPPQAQEHREYIKGLYSTLKGSDRYLKFVFLTGVSKFSKASIFSGLNMLSDISLNKKYGNICGYTQNDVEEVFKEYLDGVDLEKLKKWYNGYNFLKDDVYNPFDILQFIDNDYLFDNYWFATGTPTYLIKLIKQNNYFLPNLSNLKIGKQLLDSFDIENIDLEVILYQSGYLTIDRVVEKRRGGLDYYLKIPNEEVKQSFSDFIIDSLMSKDYSLKSDNQDLIFEALETKDLNLFQTTLESIFASIPYNHYANNNIQVYEGFYASVIYIYLQSLGLDIIGEDVTNKGRIDLTIKINGIIYILEFKVDGQKGEALKQIKEKNYHQKYINTTKEIYIIGIEFDSNEKNITKFESEKI